MYKKVACPKAVITKLTQTMTEVQNMLSSNYAETILNLHSCYISLNFLASHKQMLIFI